MKAQYKNGFPVSQLFLDVTEAVMLNTSWYIDFARKAVSAMDREIIQNIATHLGMSFLPEKEKEGEVCFINSEEVRPEFKLSFAPVDLTDYILAVTHNAYNARHKALPETGSVVIPYPKDAVDFWDLVKLGEKLRHDQGLKTLP